MLPYDYIYRKIESRNCGRISCEFILLHSECINWTEWKLVECVSYNYEFMLIWSVFQFDSNYRPILQQKLQWTGNFRIVNFVSFSGLSMVYYETVKIFINVIVNQVLIWLHASLFENHFKIKVNLKELPRVIHSVARNRQSYKYLDYFLK